MTARHVASVCVSRLQGHAITGYFAPQASTTCYNESRNTYFRLATTRNNKNSIPIVVISFG